MATYIWIAVMGFTAPIAFLFVRGRTPLKRFGANGEWVGFFVIWVTVFIVLRLLTR